MCLKIQAKRTVYLHVFSKCFWRCLVVPGRCLFSGKHLSLLGGVDAIIYHLLLKSQGGACSLENASRWLSEWMPIGMFPM